MTVTYFSQNKNLTNFYMMVENIKKSLFCVEIIYMQLQEMVIKMRYSTKTFTSMLL